jgi:hypothetical protein
MKITLAACAAAILTLSSLSAYAAGSTTAHASASFSAAGLEHANGYGVTSTNINHYGICSCTTASALAASGASGTTFGHTTSASGYASGYALSAGPPNFTNININAVSSSSVGLTGNASSYNAVGVTASNFDGNLAVGSAASSSSN